MTRLPSNLTGFLIGSRSPRWWPAPGRSRTGSGGSFDVAIAGGGLAGSLLGGVLARGGLKIAIVERERRFRDRIRGEFTWPWGGAEIDRLGLSAVFQRAGALALERLDEHLDGIFGRSTEVVPAPALTFQHVPLQNALLDWAAEQGAEIIRPARVSGYERGDLSRLTNELDDRGESLEARLVVAATGRRSGAGSWAGGRSRIDPEHPRFGGVSIGGVEFPAVSPLLGQHEPEQALLFHLGEGVARLYLRTFSDLVENTDVRRSFPALLNHVRPRFPTDVLAGAA